MFEFTYTSIKDLIHTYLEYPGKTFARPIISVIIPTTTFEKRQKTIQIKMKILQIFFKTSLKEMLNVLQGTQKDRTYQIAVPLVSD